MKPYLNKEILKQIQEAYPDIKVSLEIVNFGGDVSTFFCEFLNEQQLSQSWRDLSNSIAGYYQSEIEDEFAKWNIYLLFLCKDELNIPLKYLIENDKFSSRKIVIDNNAVALTNDLKKELIDAHITNVDIKNPLVKETNKVSYKSNSLVWKYVSKFEPGKGKKKEIEDEIDGLMQTIEIKLRDEIQKS